MKPKIYQATVSSPEELREKLQTDFHKTDFDYQFIALSLADPKVYAYPFQLPKAPRQELIKNLIDEAVELLSLHVNDIELDFQIFGTTDSVVEGVFVCIPRKLLEEYIAICDQAKLVPIHFSSQLLGCVGRLYQKHKTDQEDFAILDFTKDNRVSVALFAHGKCEFLRQIKFENIDEARSDVIQSLRSACAKSKVKNIEHVYVGNVTEEAKGLLGHIEKGMATEIVREDNPNNDQIVDRELDYFTVNLLRNYSFSLLRRKQFTMVANAVLGILIFLIVVALGRMVLAQIQISKIKSSYKKSDVDYAKSLQVKVDAIK